MNRQTSDNYTIRPSTVIPTKVVESFIQSLERFSTAIIHGPALSGKTTLAGIISAHQRFKNRRKIFLPLETRTSMSHFIRRLAGLLDLREPTSIETTLSRLEQSKTDLFIDNVDLLEASSDFFEQTVLTLKESKVVAVHAGTPRIPATLVGDILLIERLGFSIEDTETLIKTLSLEDLVPRDEMLNVHSLCNGNPLAIKSILGRTKMKGKLSRHKTNDTRADLVEDIFSNLAAPNQQALAEIAILHFDRERMNVLSESLPQSLFELCSQLDLIQQDLKGQRPSLELSKYADSNKREVFTLARERTLSELESQKSYASKKETIYQLKQVNRSKEAEAAFEELSEDLENNRDFEHALSLSYPESRSTRVTMVRLRCYAELHRFEDYNKTYSTLDQSQLSAEEKFSAQIHYIGTFRRQGRTLDAESAARNLRDTARKGSMEYFRAYREEIGFMCHRDPSLAIQTAKDVIEEYKKSKLGISDKVFAELVFVLGRSYELAGDTKEASSSYLESVKAFESCKENFSATSTKFNYAAMEYNSGNVEKALAHLTEIEEEINETVSPMLRQFCKQFRSVHLSQTGEFRKAELLLLGSFPSLTSKQDYSFDDLTIISRWLYAKFMSDPDSRNSIAKELVDNKSTHTSPSVRELITWLSEIGSKPIQNLELPTIDPAHTLQFLTEKQIHKITPKSKPIGVWLGLIEPSENFTHTINHRILASWYYIANNRLQKAIDYLPPALAAARRFKYYFWQARALLLMAILDLNKGQVELALSKLTEVDELVPKFDHFDEFDLRHALKAVCYFKLQNDKKFFDALDQINTSTPYVYFKNVLSQLKRGNTAETESAPGLHQEAKQYFDHLLDLTGIELIQKVRVKTHSSESTSFAHQLPKFKDKDYDLSINVSQSTTRIGKKEINLADKHVLFSLLQFLVLRLGEAFTKEELVTHVWHESYNPLVHDSRIYTSIKRLREIFKTNLKRDPIRSQGGKYSLSPDLRYAIVLPESKQGKLPDRQEWIMTYIRNNESIDRQTVQKLLKISPTLSKRELKELIERGLIRQEGKGKNTRYVLASS